MATTGNVGRCCHNNRIATVSMDLCKTFSVILSGLLLFSGIQCTAAIRIGKFNCVDFNFNSQLSIFNNYWQNKDWKIKMLARTWIKNGPAAMLAAKMSAGVAPEVKLRNPLHTNDEACKWGINPVIGTQGRHHQKSKTGVSVAPQRDWCPPNLFLNKSLMHTLIICVYCNFETFELSVLEGLRPVVQLWTCFCQDGDYQEFSFLPSTSVLIWQIWLLRDLGAMGRMVVKNKSGDGKKLR